MSLENKNRPQPVVESIKPLRTPHVFKENAWLRFFESRQAALEHICNHLLTYPECDRWRLLARVLKSGFEKNAGGDVDSDFQKYLATVSRRALDDGYFPDKFSPALPPIPEDSNQRFKAAKTLLKTCEVKDCTDEERRLYEFYAEITAMACVEAKTLNWWTKSSWQPPSESAMKRYEALGLLGAYVVFNEKTVVSSYLPQRMDLEEMEQNTPKPSPENPLPREGKVKLPGWNREREKRKSRAAQKKKGRRSTEEQVYYEVFRPAVQSVRQKVCDSFDMTGKRFFRSSALGAKLPRMSRLGFEDWKRFWVEMSG